MCEKMLRNLQKAGFVECLGRGPGAVWRKKGNILKRGKKEGNKKGVCHKHLMKRPMWKFPLLSSLRGWTGTIIEGDIDVPYFSERDSFRDVLLTGRLRKVVNRETPVSFNFMN